MTFNNKIYDGIKYLAMIILPACGTFYFTIAQIWNLPHCEQIVGTISAMTVFFGAIAGISSLTYNKDEIEKLDLHEEVNDIET